MFPCKLKKAVERLFCGFLAALVIFVNATAPVRAAGALATITGAAVVSAWLMACGIYPYVSDDGQTFGEWGASQLQDLADQYAATDPTGDFGLSEFTGFITGKTIAIAKGSWEKLRAFAQWIVDKFSVTDNQTGTQLGDNVYSAYNLLPRYIPSDYEDSSDFYDILSQEGFLVGGTTAGMSNPRYVAYFFGGPADVRIARYSSSGSAATMSAVIFAPYDDVNTYGLFLGYTYSSGSLKHVYKNNFIGDVTVNGVRYSYYSISSGLLATTINDEIPYTLETSNLGEVANFVYGSSSSSSGVTADTKTVSIPDALPETATYGGLTVPDAISGTAPAITDVIEQGVTDRTQPLVIPTVVEIPADTEITDDGTITANPVVVTPEMALPSVADLSLPASVIAEFKTRFPFCLPWDIMAFLSALSHTAQAPIITCDIPDPFTGQTFTITVDLSPWDDVAAIVRHFESVIIAVGFALGFRRFVLIGAHS